MRIRYDQEVDAVYIRLLEGEHQCRCVRLTDEISLNLAENDTLVGIEILDACRILGQGDLPGVVLENLPLIAAQG
ncbi:MAG: DUF2283 domain-containing protein [Candidatus Omnitrophota bacterium]|jgi:uncharacterized protein YuzE|nr:MAG: DUF2283 domain-containing protein [Candidatus Omnitrophota bacterium]